MPGQCITLPAALPRSHYFLTVSRGSGMRTYAVRPFLLHALAAILPVLLLAGLVSTLYIVFHDDLMAGMMMHQSAMQYAYEDRIEALRQDLERQSTESRAERTKLDSRVHDLFARAGQLEARAAAVADLAGRAGPQTATQTATRIARVSQLPFQITGRSPALPAAALGYASPDKPHPLTEPAATGPVPRRSEDHASLMDDVHLPLADRLTAVKASFGRVASEQDGTVTAIGAAARERVARIRSVIEDAGLSPERYLSRTSAPAAMGGPFVPLPTGADGAFDQAVAELRGTVASVAQLDHALVRLPIAAPLQGRLEVTSPFGARLDPFLGRPALHPGIDLREGYGADIRATGAGRVAFAGTAGGYGNMVEIDHGNGISTRYAHMGQIGVGVGEAISRGTVLGSVGATGRATGPHLHYEVRIDGEPVDPMRFLQTAERADVAALIGTP